LQAQITKFVGEIKDYRAQCAFLANNSADILLSADPSDNSRTVNQAWGEISGFSVESIHGMPLKNLVCEMDRDRLACLLRDAKNTRICGRRFEFRLPVPGGVRWMRAAAHFQYSQDGACEGRTSMLADITERISQNELLKKSRAALMASNASHLLYLQNVANNPRTPLHVILS
jgi:PAS domain S-box-containing protein